MPNPPLKRLLDRLGHSFRDPSLAQLALTHRSAGSRNNERLEFLGDAILGFIIAEELYSRFPEAQEGELSRLRASLVKGVTLAEVARELGMGDYLLLGPGELKSGGFRRDSILACALEAMIGAVYLDAGEPACRELVLRLFDSRLASADPSTLEKDPKTRLQEYLQGRGAELPEYRLIKVEGEQHAQTFHVECIAEGLDSPVEGCDRSRRKAEQQAARKALALLQQKDDNGAAARSA